MPVFVLAPATLLGVYCAFIANDFSLYFASVIVYIELFTSNARTTVALHTAGTQSRILDCMTVVTPAVLVAQFARKSLTRIVETVRTHFAEIIVVYVFSAFRTRLPASEPEVYSLVRAFRVVRAKHSVADVQSVLEPHLT